MKRPNLDKAPKIVRTYIDNLEAGLRHAQQQIDTMLGKGSETSEVFIKVWDPSASDSDRPLQPGSTIVFVLDKGRHIEAQVVLGPPILMAGEPKASGKRHPPRLMLRGVNRYGSGMLAVHPETSNGLQVFIDPQDEHPQAPR